MNTISTTTNPDRSYGNSKPTPPPATKDVDAFNKAMQSTPSSSEQKNSSAESNKQAEPAKKTESNKQADSAEKTENGEAAASLPKEASEADKDKSTPDSSSKSQVIPGGSDVNPNGATQSGQLNTRGNDPLIPIPTKNIQVLNFGDKQVIVGGDGTGSPKETEDSARTIEHAYQNSPTFKDMIDNSSDPFTEITIGRTGNNNYGSPDGRIYLNLTNNPPGGKSWYHILAHEMGHAAKDLPHGPELEAITEQVKKEV